ncbi:hypothetical protein ACIOZL_22925 [Streptomyces sp. NPDC087769]|uniref:hypothetical protein n=1 Tax=Streptomyces sp. NPDC087769 TaxID=3365802 RepID=UPI00382C17EC
MAGTPVTTTARTTPATRTDAPPTGPAALQACPGNAMVVRMLRAAGHPRAQEPPPYAATAQVFRPGRLWTGGVARAAPDELV